MKLKTLKTITSHTLTRDHKLAALYRFFKRGLIVRIIPYPIVYPFIGQSKLLIEKGMSSAELQLFTGLYDFEEMLFLLHTLIEDDLFVDVGANVGVYTILASSVKACRSISIEPVPDTFIHLENNIAINHIAHKVSPLNIGISDKAGILKFTKNLNSSLNHVEFEDNSSQENIEVKVDSLDQLLGNETPIIIKIDVEGFETMVINGAKEVLKKDSLKAIIIELNGLSNKYGFNDHDIHQAIVDQGFLPYVYQPLERKLEKMEAFGEKNTIYIRDLDFVKNRILKSHGYRVLNRVY